MHVLKQETSTIDFGFWNSGANSPTLFTLPSRTSAPSESSLDKSENEEDAVIWMGITELEPYHGGEEDVSP